MDDIEAVKAEYLNHQFEEKSFTVEAEKVAEFAKACGETLPKFTDPSDPDFQAPPTYVSCFARGRNLPEGFPMFGGTAFDGSNSISSSRLMTALYSSTAPSSE